MFSLPPGPDQRGIGRMEGELKIKIEVNSWSNMTKGLKNEIRASRHGGP